MGKLPEPSRVKTRLVPPLSPEAAAAAHDLFVRETLDMAASVAGAGRTVFCFDPPHACDEARRRYGTACDVTLHPQQPGDLGERLMAAYAELSGGDAVLFFGCDSPVLPAGHVTAAMEHLRNGADVVLGPCDDGGYWCLGVGPGVDLAAVLGGVEWSSGRELGQTENNARDAGLRVERAGAWSDVDRPGDLANLLTRLPPDSPLRAGLYNVLGDDLFEQLTRPTPRLMP